MEYRDHFRAGGVEPGLDEPAGRAGFRPRFRRFEFRGPERRLDPSRIVLAGMALLLGLATVGYLGIQAVRSALHWLHRQPPYLIPFREIQLLPPPPAWFRGGSAAFLRQVRERANEPEVLPVLDLDSGGLSRAFQDYCPWVDEVVRIEYPPQQIVVHLVYKRPVALHETGPGSEVVLDRNGHILPGEDIDRERLGRLIRILGHQLLPSPENRPGGIWKSGATGSEAERLERCLRGAASLAGFLQEPGRLKDRPETPALSIASIFATDPRGLFVQTDEGVQILWGEPPGLEGPGALQAQEKWEILKQWAVSTARRKLAHRGYWTFGRSELRAVEPSVSRS